MSRPSLWQRIVLTVQNHGVRSLLVRALTLPLRFTPLADRLPYGPKARSRQARARRWYRRHGRPVTVVIPAYGPAEQTIATVESVLDTTSRRRVRVVVADDASPPEQSAGLRELNGAHVVFGDHNLGFAGNVNRALAHAPEGDVVILNNDIRAHRSWLETLQHAAYSRPETGIVGPKLLYADGRIQHAGVHRNLGAPEWFDHRYRFAPSTHGPANIAAPVLAVTGACMYVKRELLDRVGAFDEGYGMAYEDVDLCLRAWEAGYRVEYEPDAELTHFESTTRGMTQGERELSSQRRFWERWGDWFERRSVRTDDGRLRVVYVTEDTGIGGGHRDIFEHLNHLAERGHEAELWSLGGQPDWFDLRVPVRTFEGYPALARELEPVEAIKVATWWGTAPWVWLASVRRGVPVYFVQDVETSYYPGQELAQAQVLDSYRHEFRYMTISTWNAEQLARVGVSAELIPPGIDLDNFRELGIPRRADVVLCIGRSNPLKNLPLTIEAWRMLDPRPELWMFGIEPELATDPGMRYFESPSDERVNELMNECTVFVQTSRHEGFCLPLVEAMAAGAPVVSTDADGNRDFCEHEVNCLMTADDPESVSAALRRVLDDAELRARLVEGGRRTAATYGWEQRIDALEALFERLAAERAPTSG